MKTSAYRERDYVFGEKMLTLRTEIGLTQAELGKHLGISRRSVGEWETGSSYPKTEHLKKVIALAVKNRAFPAGHEAEEIRMLWKVARQNVLLDERWLSALLDRPPSSHLHLVSAPIEETMPNASVEPLSASRPLVDWGDALAVPIFYGREAELTQLTQWVVQERCRVVSLLGMGGIGKSALAVKLMYQSARHFEVVIFRSLRNVPSCEALLDECLQVLSPHSLSIRPTTLEQRLSLLLPLLRTQRVLVVLDNIECLLVDQDVRGHFRSGFEGYGQLLRRVAETVHESCLLLTSREKLAELRSLESKHSPVRSLRLYGLSMAACRQLFEEQDLVGTEADQDSLIEIYMGNPLALKIVAETIFDLFDGEIGVFLSLGTVLFGGIAELLEEHFARLSPLEQRVLCWLAIVREPVTIEELLALLATPETRTGIFEAIDSGYRRSLIERGKRAGRFTLQSVVLEYVTALLVAEGSSEIQRHQLVRLIEHGLSQAQAKEYVRQTQERLLLTPLLVNLRSVYQGEAEAEQQLLGLLEELREKVEDAQGYGPANLLSLLRLQRGNLNGLDLSHLCLRRVSLQSIEMHDTSLAFSLMRESVLTQAISVIYAVAIGLDGKWWAAGSLEGKVSVWHEENPTLHLMWQAHSDMVITLAFSPDGRTLASGGLDNTVKLWDVGSGLLLWTSRQTGPLNLAFTPDGSLLASGGMETTVRLWDTQSGKNLQTFTHASFVSGVAFSPNGCLFASGDADGHIRLWERQKGEWVEIRSLQTNWVASLAFAPDSRTLASANWGDQTVKLWEVASLRQLHVLPGHADQSYCVAWSPDSSALAYCSADKAIWLWDVEQSRCRAMLQGHTAEVYGMAFTPDGTKLLSGSADSTLRVWDVESYRGIHVTQCYGVSLWDLDWSPDSMHLVSGGTDGLVTLWGLSEGMLPTTLHGHSWIVSGVGWSPDGQLVASCGWDRVLCLWDLTTHACVQRLEDLQITLLSMAWSPNGYLLACGTLQQGIQVWNVTTHSLRLIGQTHPVWFYCVAWRPNSTQIVGGGDDGCVYLWESADGTPRAKLSGHQERVWSIAWSPDGRYLSSGGSGELFLWDVEIGERVQTLARPSGVVSALAWCPNGNRLVSGDSSGALSWWDIESGECVNKQEAHQGIIRCLKVSPDGKSLASCGDDGAIRIWDLSSGAHLQTLRHDRPYERLNITGIRGLTKAEIVSLQALGAIGEAAP